MSLQLNRFAYHRWRNPLWQQFRRILDMFFFLMMFPWCFKGRMSIALELFIFCTSTCSILLYCVINVESWICGKKSHSNSFVLTFNTVRMNSFYPFTWSSKVFLNIFWIGYNKCLKQVQYGTMSSFLLLFFIKWDHTMVQSQFNHMNKGHWCSCCCKCFCSRINK